LLQLLASIDPSFLLYRTYTLSPSIMVSQSPANNKKKKTVAAARRGGGGVGKAGPTPIVQVKPEKTAIFFGQCPETFNYKRKIVREPDLQRLRSVTAGGSTTAYLLDDGGLLTVGSGEFGELARSSLDQSKLAAPGRVVMEGLKVKSDACSDTGTLILTDVGDAYFCGTYRRMQEGLVEQKWFRHPVSSGDSEEGKNEAPVLVADGVARIWSGSSAAFFVAQLNDGALVLFGRRSLSSVEALLPTSACVLTERRHFRSLYFLPRTLEQTVPKRAAAHHVTR